MENKSGKNSNLLLVLLLLIFLFFGIWWIFSYKSGTSHNGENLDSSSQASPTQKTLAEGTESEYILDGYPFEVVPLYKLEEIDSFVFVVNKDPGDVASYFGKEVNYYNIVYKTEVSASEVFAYYKSLMSEQNPDSPSDQIQGMIGKYKVSVSHYGEDTKDVYLRVYLPIEEYKSENPFYGDYPSSEVFEIDPGWVELSSSFGKLNQKGGEVEYYQYFLLPNTEAEQDELIQEYQNKYQNETNYRFDDEQLMLTWEKDDYEVVLFFSKSHGRIYLTIRKPLQK